MKLFSFVFLAYKKIKLYITSTGCSDIPNQTFYKSSVASIEARQVQEGRFQMEDIELLTDQEVETLIQEMINIESGSSHLNSTNR